MGPGDGGCIREGQWAVCVSMHCGRRGSSRAWPPRRRSEGLSSAEASARAQRTEQLEAAARLQEVQGRCATLELAAERERKGWEGLQGEVDDAKQMHAACEGELARAREQRAAMIRAFYFKHYESHRASKKLARHSDCVLNNKKQ